MSWPRQLPEFIARVQAAIAAAPDKSLHAFLSSIGAA